MNYARLFQVVSQLKMHSRIKPGGFIFKYILRLCAVKYICPPVKNIPYPYKIVYMYSKYVIYMVQYTKSEYKLYYNLILYIPIYKLNTMNVQ